VIQCGRNGVPSLAYGQQPRLCEYSPANTSSRPSPPNCVSSGHLGTDHDARPDSRCSTRRNSWARRAVGSSGTASPSGSAWPASMRAAAADVRLRSVCARSNNSLASVTALRTFASVASRRPASTCRLVPTERSTCETLAPLPWSRFQVVPAMASAESTSAQIAIGSTYTRLEWTGEI